MKTLLILLLISFSLISCNKKIETKDTVNTDTIKVKMVMVKHNADTIEWKGEYKSLKEQDDLTYEEINFLLGLGI